MGDIVSKIFQNYPNGFGPDSTNPKKRDWITRHAELANISLLECERLWVRFQQLGCDENGTLHVSHLANAGMFKEDILFRNLLMVMMTEDTQKLYFHTFINAMHWVTNATIDEKCKAIFYFFTGGGPFVKELFTKIIKRIYPDKDDATINSYTDIVFNSSSGTRQGELTYEDFMRIINAFPERILDDILHFEAMPKELTGDSNQVLSPQKENEKGTVKDPSYGAQVCDESIDQLSSAMNSSADYHLVFEALGFSQVQISRYEKKYTDKVTRIKEMLKSWKQFQEEDAICGVLRSALDTGKKDLSAHVYGMKPKS